MRNQGEVDSVSINNTFEKETLLLESNSRKILQVKNRNKIKGKQESLKEEENVLSSSLDSQTNAAVERKIRQRVLLN
jgi:hypothetical protein